MQDHRSISFNGYFEEVFARFSKGLLVYAKTFGLTEYDAEDVVSEIFVNYWERMDAISQEGMKAYLFRSVRNACLNHLAHLRIRSAYQEKVLREKELPVHYPDLFVEDEMEALLLKALDTLPPRQEKVFRMHKLEDKSYRQIAEELDITVKATYKHYGLALKHVREYLLKAGYILALIKLTQ